MSERVTTTVEDGVLVITLNRPEARNAINLETAEVLAAALDRLNDDDSLRLGVLTGAGGTFCSGMDLKAFAATGQRPYVGDRGFGGLCAAPPAKPLIAAVEGFAVAGGCELALACDMIVAADNAHFGLPEVKRGLVPGSCGMLRLPRHIPYHIAMEWVLTGDAVTAQRAYEVGLVNRLVSPGQALEGALALARSVAANGPMAVRIAKQVVTQSGDWSVGEMFDRQRPMIAPVFESVDAREGARAFAEKRAPVWQGR
ncbi:MAG: crotonase/enoyl-CoA hydratase family protein [Burkholderiaceae bacterium]|nr:crotonase/enoyl-CoA hydratase family protein [Burkholderiaceae bacterium]